MTARTRMLAAWVAFVLLSCLPPVELDACGDKFLRFGRSARHGTYGAIHPASILLYVPATATPADVREFEDVLKRAGHRAVVVRSLGTFLDALGTSTYDLVIANYVDAARLKEPAASAPSRPMVLPIVYKLKKAIVSEIKREYGHIVEDGANRLDLLAEIDHAMKDRLSRRS